ncbi:CRISPR system precrRNA processing endoribonuclease RAMP protein Cas6 [Mailhella massiliensis]|uniref:CRISPR system precrRNA processing endoribonuclease RAMP protein Cas6 n=1 Tax=Mailhella massiliensis TaxID=1903261 RepID=UPI0023552C9E|nr:CRISPR system precrRNA processing endoribonuclease RAMP protein Cas6 [Mailhella massiliensis]
MKKASFTFQYRLTARAAFSAYKGSMLRGSLGTFLKKTCCTMHRHDCTDCILAGQCAFPLLFMGKTTDNGQTLPPPYCIIPKDTGKIFYDQGENFSFDLILFSYAVDYLPYFVHAFHLAGQKGMGKNTEDIRGTCELEHIFHKGMSIFNKETLKMDIPAEETLPLPLWIPEPAGTGSLLIQLQSPCRFKAENHLSAALPFRQLFQLIVRRIRSLWLLDGEHVTFEDFSAMLDAADAVKTVESNLFWKDWSRYSSRQKSAMQLGGLQGSVRYYGAIAAFLPFLSLAEKLHIGKQTSFGLGRFSFVWLPDEKNAHLAVR